MTISSTTKISALIKANPDSIEAIVAINKHFEKLRNPILRKILASRVTIADAAKIGKCSVNDFFEKLIPLGFVVSPDPAEISKNAITAKVQPVFMQKISADNTITLDVRAGLASGKDPFQKIMETLASMPPDNFLLIINTFEPSPLINVLKRKGFDYYTEEVQKDLFHTYFGNTAASSDLPKGEETRNTCLPYPDSAGGCSFPDFIPTKEGGRSGEANDFDNRLDTFIGKIKTIDVRHLEMPLPMVTILQELEKLDNGGALFVHHKKIPQFLLPELQESGFKWLIREDGEGDVKLLIFR